ncbi:SUR7/PalI family-domain-containing protein [Mycotypha africana]|uniref:SUR7/PalI family-domain-containing protein n=1 Tax=Mycotypha africana TaxID=64632 RepID=UPI0022FFF2E6|nr:SUR7/PalI family-domain-containing protein [Mycotypha africana]KAI8991031.1 SUR7/PalI family-domain-containing protein [Mycotypha africana]
MFSVCTAIGSIFLLFSFLLEFFLIIGNVSPKPLIRDVYFAQAWNTGQGRSYNFGLWNYCNTDNAGYVTSCAKTSAAYNWAQAPGVNQAVPGMANSYGTKGVFLALFILLFIAMGLSFIFWLMSLPICCSNRRGLGYSMTTLVLINFFIMLAALILALVLVIGGIRQLTRADRTWSAQAGNSVWITIGAVVSLFLSFLCYSGGVCCCKPKNDGYYGKSSRRRKKNDYEADYGYNNDYNNNYGRDAGYAGAGYAAGAYGTESSGKAKRSWWPFGGRKNKQVNPDYNKEYDSNNNFTRTDNNNYTRADNNTAADNSNAVRNDNVGTTTDNSNLYSGTNQAYNTNDATQGDTMLQQSYMSPTAEQQNTYGETAYNTTAYNTTANGGATVNDATHGYQTPVLEPANLAAR